MLDLSEFWLQYCYGAVSINDNQDRHVFHDAYQGSNCSHVIRHLQPCQSYTLRVCGRAEGAGVWSPWSIPQVAMSSLPPYGDLYFILFPHVDKPYLFQLCMVRPHIFKNLPFKQSLVFNLRINLGENKLYIFTTYLSYSL